MGADGVPREQAELAEMEVRAEGSRRGFSKLGGAPVRNGIPCLFREPRSCGKSFASLDAAQFRCAAEQKKKRAIQEWKRAKRALEQSQQEW